MVSVAFFPSSLKKKERKKEKKKKTHKKRYLSKCKKITLHLHLYKKSSWLDLSLRP